MNTTDSIKQYLAIQMGNFERGIAFVKSEIAVKNVHQLRITARRIRAVLWLLRDSSGDLNIKPTDRTLNNLIKLLGAVREIDISKRVAGKFDFDWRQKYRSSHFSARKKALGKFLESGECEKALKELQTLRDSLQNLTQLQITPRLKKLEKKFQKIDRIPVHDSAKAHQLRILFKKARYALEACSISADNLPKLQDHLGSAHDLEVLEDYFPKEKKLKKERLRQLQKADAILDQGLPSHFA